jgi:PKD repeat protein
MRLRVLAVLLGALVWAAGCSLSSPGTPIVDGPALTGPSAQALSIVATASPNVLTQDGASASMIIVKARDANGQPVSGLSLRLSMFVGTTSVDYGTLSTKAISTDSGGSASAIYTAPPPPPITVTSDTAVTIQVVPVQYQADVANTNPTYLEILLTRPGVILPPNPTVKASFTFSPLTPQEDQQIQFDASASAGANLTYAWAFGDGKSATGVRPTHSYSIAGAYGVTLTVTDDRGTFDSGAPITINVTPAADPTAAFAISPQSPSVGDDVFFDGSLSTTPIGSGRTISGYSWNFGDGSSGSGQKVSHQYQKAGQYTIVLNVTDSSGRRGTVTGQLQVK